MSRPHTQWVNPLEKTDISQRLKFYLRDFCNLLRYGSHAPGSAQLIWVDPSEITTALKRTIIRRKKNPVNRKATGMVIHGDWDLHVRPIQDLLQYDICKKRFVYGYSWEDTGAMDLMSRAIEGSKEIDGCTDREDVLERYKGLDHLFETVRRTGKIQTRQELLGRTWFRENWGIYVHISRDCRPVFGGGGCHRLMIAKIADLDLMPAQLGAVHPLALRHWKKIYTAQKG